MHKIWVQMVLKGYHTWVHNTNTTKMSYGLDPVESIGYTMIKLGHYERSALNQMSIVVYTMQTAQYFSVHHSTVSCIAQWFSINTSAM